MNIKDLIERIRNNPDCIEYNGHSKNFNDFTKKNFIDRIIWDFDTQLSIILNTLIEETGYDQEELLSLVKKDINDIDIPFGYHLYNFFEIFKEIDSDIFNIFLSAHNSFYNCDKCGNAVVFCYNYETDKIYVHNLMKEKDIHCTYSVDKYKEFNNYKSTGTLVLSNRFLELKFDREKIDFYSLESTKGRTIEYINCYKKGIFYTQTDEHSVSLFSNNDRTKIHFISNAHIDEDNIEDYSYIYDGEEFNYLTEITTDIWRFEFCDGAQFELLENKNTHGDLEKIEIPKGDFTYINFDLELNIKRNCDNVKIFGMLNKD